MKEMEDQDQLLKIPSTDFSMNLLSLPSSLNAWAIPAENLSLFHPFFPFEDTLGSICGFVQTTNERCEIAPAGETLMSPPKVNM